MEAIVPKKGEKKLAEKLFEVSEKMVGVSFQKR